MEFVVIPSDEYEELIKPKPKPTKLLSPLAQTLLSGKAVFVVGVDSTTRNRLSQYYEVARIRGLKFVRTKSNRDGKDGFLCKFEEKDDQD